MKRIDWAGVTLQPHLSVSRDVPHPDTVVECGGYTVAAVHRHPQVPQLAQFATGREIPYADGVVRRPRYNMTAVGRHGHLRHHSGVSLQLAQLVACRDVPKADGVVS